MHVVPPDRADPQDGDLQDGGMELRDDLPQAGLPGDADVGKILLHSCKTLAL